MPSKKMFLEHNYVNVWGKEITAFSSPDMKVVVELQSELKGDYWWTKLKTTLEQGNDGALNFSREQCLSLASIYEEIERRNIAAGNHKLRNSSL